MRKIKLRVAITLDGFIADTEGGVDWLHRFHAKGTRTDYGMTAFFRSIDTVLMGRHTHDFALSHGMKGYSGKKNFVFTCTKPPGKRDGVEYISQDPAEVIAALRQKPGKDIWLCGGGDLARQLLEALCHPDSAGRRHSTLSEGLSRDRPPTHRVQDV
jgi:dihydrofolate reductase